MKRITIDDGLFNIHIDFCWDTDDATLAKFMRRKYGVDTTGDHTGDGFFLRLENTNGTDVGIIAMTCHTFDGSPYSYSILVHECYHATCQFLKSRGVRYSKNSEEVFAYLLDSLVESAATKALAYEARLLR